MIRISLFAILPLSIATAMNDEDILEKKPLTAKSSWDGETLFERIPSDRSGVKMRYEFDTRHPLKRLYAFGWATGNVAIGDLDGDGRADLFFPGTTGPHRLFLQRDDFSFEDVTATAQLGGDEVWGSCAALGDVDGDGDLDIYVANYDSPNQLFMNISRGGKVRFTELAEDYGVDAKTGSLGASFVDFDGDGKLDFFLQAYHLEPEAGRPEEVPVEIFDEVPVVEPPLDSNYMAYLDNEEKPQWTETPLADRIFRNEGRGRFAKGVIGGVGLLRGYTSSHVWWDVDENSRPDLYLGHDGHGPDAFFVNRNGSSLSEVSIQALPFTSWHSRGGVAGDFNNDQIIDLFTAESSPLTHRERLEYGEPLRQDIIRVASSGGVMQVPRNVLFSGTGTPRFEEVARMAGLDRTGATWAVKAGDYDGDGWTDLFFATGEARDRTSLPSTDLEGESLAGKTRWDILEDKPERRERDRVFRNLGNWQFEDKSSEWGLDHLGMSYAAGQGDLDGDGDLDLVVCPLGEEVILYRNHSQNDRIVLEFNGKQTNRYGIGNEMLVEIGGSTRMQQLYPSGGFKGADEPAFFIGMGGDTEAEKVTVKWTASGALTTVEKLQSGFRYTLAEAFSLVPALTRERPSQPMFAVSDSLGGTGYSEVPFDDLAVQPLLPRGLSRFGPSLALYDLDDDRLSEIFVGGSRNVAPNLIARSPLLGNAGEAIARDAANDDAGAVFFDADNDGDTDLFVASGGIETGLETALLRDRLYLQNDVRVFLPAPANAIPGAEENSGAVAAADFDRDGDVDVFVASRFEIGKFPQAGRSRLLQNDGTGRFTNVIDSNALGLATAGAVTSAIWSDVDGDGWLDLLMTTHWGPVHCWKNDGGRLTPRTGASGLETLTGLWNAITGRDIDNDGDIDYLVTNEGLNSGYEAPARLYSGDFLDIGTDILLETRAESGTLYPARGWLDFAELKPSLLEEEFTPKRFVNELMPRMLSEENLAAADSWTAAVLESGLLINDGAGNFEFRPLPRDAQISQGYGAVLTDVDADGNCDAYLVQNRGSASLRNPDPGTTGASRLFLGTGDPSAPFRPVRADTSGLLLFGAGRALGATDSNNDSRVDFVATINGSDPAIYLNETETPGFQPLKVVLDTKGKHPAGARVTVEMPGFPTQTAEYYAGSGWLSQSSAELFFGAPKDPEDNATVTIYWADDTRTRRRIYFDNQ